MALVTNYDSIRVGRRVSPQARHLTVGGSVSQWNVSSVVDRNLESRFDPLASKIAVIFSPILGCLKLSTINNHS